MSLRKILHVTDFSDASLPALELAAQFARATNGEVHVVHVLALGADDPATVDASLQRYVPDSCADVVTERRKVRAVSPETGIVHEARKGGYDAVALGTHGRSGLSHVLLGSVAERVVRLAPCPVLTVRPRADALSHPEEVAR